MVCKAVYPYIVRLRLTLGEYNANCILGNHGLSSNYRMIYYNRSKVNVRAREQATLGALPTMFNIETKTFLILILNSFYY